MTSISSFRHGSRLKLADVSRREAERRLQGDANYAGLAIEPYLAVFRDALNLNCESDRFSNLNVGYSWCCAFVYYCCLQAGFHFPPKPMPDYRYTLAAVPAWHHWATAGGFFLSGDTTPAVLGDIVLFNNVAGGQLLDHIGIVVEVTPSFILCAEGNVENRTGLFKRSFACIAGYVRLPETA
ncbi:CHAP domain-containing protein [Verrucomicrobiota bacterium sgz303538]